MLCKMACYFIRTRTIQNLGCQISKKVLSISFTLSVIKKQKNEDWKGVGCEKNKSKS